jgi:hypothetical protein
MMVVVMVVIRTSASNCRDGDCGENYEGDKAAHRDS